MKHKHRTPRSLLFHLVLVLIGTATLINLMVFSFFKMTAPPRDFPWERHLTYYNDALIRELGSPPSFEKARQLSEELSLEIAYRGAGSSWKTDDRIEDLDFLRNNLLQEGDFNKWHKNTDEKHNFVELSLGHYENFVYKITETSDGTFVFWLEGPSWAFRTTRNLVSLVIFLSLVFLLAAWLLRRLVLPLRTMEKAFAEVSQGRFNTRLKLIRPREFRNAANGFNSMVERISEMIEKRDRMIQDVSHEFRSPLARMGVALDLLPDSGEKAALKEDAAEMEELIAEILEAYRSSDDSGGNKELRCDLVRTAKEQVEKIRREHGSLMFVELYKTDSWVVSADPKKIGRVFMNLLKNAVKFNDGAKPVAIEISEEGVVRFIDEGSGVAPADRPHIFDPFYRADEGRTRGGGYGLGLFFCREIVRSAGGSIVFAENTPRGSIFEVSLPRKV